MTAIVLRTKRRALPAVDIAVEVGPEPPSTFGSQHSMFFFSGTRDEHSRWVYVPEAEIGDKASRAAWLKHIARVVEVSDANGRTWTERYHGVYERLADEARAGAHEHVVTADELRELEREIQTRPQAALVADDGAAPEAPPLPAGYALMHNGIPVRVLR